MNVQPMTPEGAIRVVARHVIAAAVEDRVGEMWELYPDIGEHDWDRVCEQVEQVLTDTIRGPSREFDIAYGLLDLRAEGKLREVGSIEQPVCLGPDGRVWDGHHRIVAAHRLGFYTIPIEDDVDEIAQHPADQPA